MIIPIGHEQTEVRRLPWVTIAVIVLCFAAFLATDVPSPADPWADEAAWEEAADYWMQHAYLEPKPEILDYTAEYVAELDREAYVEQLRELNPQPFNLDLVLDQQRELDELSARALGLLLEGSLDNDYTRWGLTPTQLRPVNLITHMFMHAGWIHLLGNLFLFFIAAPAIEDRWGRPLFASFYLLAGVFAGGFYALLSPTSSIPLVGASGAIAGMLGAFLVRFWSTKINFAYFFFFGLRWVRGTFEAPAFLMLPLWFGTELFQAWLFHSTGMSDGVAYWAHVGGFLFGVGGAALIASLKIEQRFIHGAIESKVTLMEGNPVLEQAMQAREDGDLEQAFSLLQAEIPRSRDDTDLALAFWDVAVASQHAEAAAPAMIAAIRRTAGRGDVELATNYWLDMTDVLPGALADPGSLLRIAPELVKRERPEKAVRALRHSSDPKNRWLTAGLALRLIEQARELDPPSALQAAHRALEFEDIHETKRTRLEQVILDLEASGVELPEPEVEIAASPSPSAPGGLEDEPSIPLAGEDGPAVAALAAAPVAAAVAAAPRALGADGALIDGGASAPELALDPQAELGFDPSAELEALPAVEFGMEPGAELGLDPEALQAETLGAETEDTDAMAFGMLGEGAIDLEAEEALEAATPPPLPIGTPPPLPASPPPVPQAASTQAIEPPPLSALSAPSAEAAELPPPLEPIAQAEPSDSDDIDLGESIADADLLALIDIPRFPGVKVVEAVPRELAANGLVIRLNGNRKGRVEYGKVQAIAVAAVGGIAESPVLIIDLALNWNDASEGPLRVVRLRSDQFSPTGLVEGAANATEAIRSFLGRLIEATDAVLLPDEDSARAKPIHSQDDLESYHRQVLQSAR